MESRKLIGLLILPLLTSCAYDLDFRGVLTTEVPVNDRFEISREWTAMNGEEDEIPVGGNGYHVLIGGDSHVGGTDNLSSLIARGIEGGAAFISIAGDLTTGREEDYEICAQELASAGDLPVFTVPGNHDLYFGGWESFYAYFGASSYTVSVRNADTSDLFIFLDTGGGTLGSDQLNWLQELLKEKRGNYRHAIVITHVNFIRNRFTGSTNPLNQELLVLYDLFARYNIQFVIQGHDHKRYIEQFGNTVYITLDAMFDGYKDASYLELRIDGENLEYSFTEF